MIEQWGWAAFWGAWGVAVTVLVASQLVALRIEPGVDPTPEELQTLDRCLALVQLIKQNALLQGTVKLEEVAPGMNMLESLKQRALALADETSDTEAAQRVGVHRRTLGMWKRKQEQQRRLAAASEAIPL